MTALSYTNVIDRFFVEALDPILKSFVYNSYADFANHLRYPLGLAIILFITILGISISQGWVKLSIENFAKAALKIGFVYTFAMNWSIFSQLIVDGIQKSAEQIGGWLLEATPIPIPNFAGPGIQGALQSVLIEIAKMYHWVWSAGSWHNLGPYLTAGMIFGFGYSMILIGLFEIVVAKIMLAVLFATAPLFISFTLFKKTHSFFDRWLGLIVGFAFLMIFIMAVLALALSFMQWAIGGTFLEHATGIRLVGFIPAMLVGFIGIGILKKASQMAQAIGGAVMTASGSELLAGAVGGFVGGSIASAKAPINALKKLFGGRGGGGSGDSGGDQGGNNAGGIGSGLKKAGAAMNWIKGKLRKGEE